MNKIFKVKRNSAGQSVVTSEIAKSHGRVLVLAVAAAIASHSAVATTVYSTTSPEVKFGDKNTILIGSDLHVETEKAHNSSNISIGNKSKFYDLADSISIGNNNILGDQSTLNNGNQPVRAIAIGSDNKVGHQSIGIGGGTVSNSPFSIAIGDMGGSASRATTATGFGSIAIGGNAKALIAPNPIFDATRNIAIGSSSFTNAKEAIAFGYNANATHDNSVALGSNAVTEASVSTSSVTNNGIKYTFNGPSSAVVSIGHKNNGNDVNRQIVNVAAGRVSDSSTDAVNGSQLYAAISTLGNVATSAKNILGGDAALAANGTISMTNIGGTGQNTIHDAIAFADDKAVAAQNTANTAVTKADAAQATANTANATAQTANNTANLIAATTYTFGIANEQAAAASNTGIADKWSTTKADSLTLGATSDLSVTTDGAGKVIYGLSDATKANITKAQTDAVKGIADAKAADDKATAAKTVVDELKPVVEKNTAEIAKKADKTYVDAELAKKADQSALDATNQTVADNKAAQDAKNAQLDATNVAQDAEIAKKAEQSALDATNAKVKANTDAIAKGFNVKTSDATSTNYQLGDTVSILGGKNIDTKTTTDGITVSLKDDIAVKTIAIDGSTVGLSAAGVNAGNLKVTGVADGAITADSKDAVNGSQLHAVKVVADTAKAQSDANTADIARLDNQKADKTALKATNDKLNALDNAAVKYDDPTTKDKVTLGGADGTTISNVKAGVISADSKDAVNGSQLYALTEKVNNLDATDVVAGKGTTVTKSTQGNLNTYTVSVSDETLDNITKAQTDAAKGIADAKAADDKAVAAQNTANTAVTKADAAQATADKAAEDIKALDDIAVKYDTTTKDTVTLGGADGTTITNVKDGAITAGSKDAVNGSQLHAVKVVADAAKAQSDANTADIARLDNQKADKTALEATDAKVKANADTIAKGFNVKTSDGTSTNYQLGDTVSILGGKNIDTTTTTDGITVSLKDDIAVKTITIDGSTVGLSATGVNAGDLKVTGVADGEVTADSKDAVNGSQLHAVKVVADTAKAQSDANKAAINALDDKKADKSALASTNDKLNALDNAAVKYDDPTAKDKVTLGGVDGTTITNVKAGAITANSTDAVNGSQLFDVYNYVNQGNDAMRQHIDTVEDKLQAGIAGSNASAALPQVRGNGKSMMAFGLGGFQDKGALAVGYSRSSDNGRTVFKAHLNADTEKQIGGGIGLGFEW